ncbi:hypothetical protein WN943_003443 [Citrus x changshan-huyou]
MSHRNISFKYFSSSNCWNKEDGTLLLSLGLSKRFHNFNDLKFFLDYGREKVANFTLLPVYRLHFRKHQKVKVLSKSCANIFPWSSFSGALALCRALKFHLESSHKAENLGIIPKNPKKNKTSTYTPITLEKPTVELVNVTQDMKSFNAYDKLCIKRINELHIGTRMRKAAEAEKEEKK